MDSINSPHPTITSGCVFILIKYDYLMWIEYGDRGVF